MQAPEIPLAEIYGPIIKKKVDKKKTKKEQNYLGRQKRKKRANKDIIQGGGPKK